MVAQSTAGRLVGDAYGVGRNRAGGFGSDVAVIADVNGDGTPDVVVADRSEDQVVLLSGVDLTRIRTIATQTQFCDAVDDVDGDGMADIASASRFNLSVFSGASGATVFSTSVSESYDVAGIGDWNGDGTPDVARRQLRGVDLHSGSDGATLQTLGGIFTTSIAAIGGPASARLALCERSVSLYLAGGTTAWTSQAADYVAVGAGGDVDRDGFEEVLAMAGTGRVDVLSGASGGVLSTLTTSGGNSVAGGVDLDGDAVADVVVGDRTSGFMRAYSASSGAVLIERFGHSLSDGFATATALHPGVGTPGRAAVVVGAPGRFGNTVRTGAVLAFAQAAPGEVEGSIESFGSSCSFSQLYPNPGLPRIGARFGLRFDSNSGAGFQYVLIGASKTSFNGVPLPVVPTSSPCELLVSIDIVQNAGLSANASIFIPNNPAFVGTVVHVQGASLTANPFFARFETSNGLSLHIGN